MGSGKKKIEIKKIEKESSRMTTFSKRRQGLFKKADEFRSKTGAKVGILVISPTGKPYPFGDIDAVYATLMNPSLKSGLEMENQSMMMFSCDGYVDGSNCSGTSNMDLKKKLNEINVDDWENIEELLLLKEQLEEAKTMMMKAEVESWTL